MKKIKAFFKRYLLFFQKARFFCMRNGTERAEFLKKKGILRAQGEHVYFYSRIFPADPKLLVLHNNIAIATNVRFVNHDRMDYILRGMKDCKAKKTYGCIEIMDNVFIGTDVTILPDVRIGPNAIVGAGSIVTKDVPEGVIAAGNPARVIGSFDEFVAKRMSTLNSNSNPDFLWAEFEKKRAEK